MANNTCLPSFSSLKTRCFHRKLILVVTLLSFPGKQVGDRHGHSGLGGRGYLICIIVEKECGATRGQHKMKKRRPRDKGREPQGTVGSSALQEGAHPTNIPILA